MIGQAQGKILIATPQVSGIFRQTVIYVHTDDDTGSIGVLLNVPMDSDTAKRFSRDIGWQYPDRIRLGGPVERQLGYVLHSNDYAQESSIELNDYLSYTGGKNIVDDINFGVGPHSFMLVTGYCAWQPGQLDREIEEGTWMLSDFDPDYFFQDLDREAGWEFAVHLAAQNRTTQLLDTVDSV